MEDHSFTRPSLSGCFSDSRTESRFLIQMNNLEAMTQYWKEKFEKESTNKSLIDELAEEKEKNQLLANELAEEQSANKSLDDELAEEQSVLKYLANELEKEKANLKKIAYDLSKEKSVSHRLRLERLVYMMCFSVGAISILMYDWCSKLN